MDRLRDEAAAAGASSGTKSSEAASFLRVPFGERRTRSWRSETAFAEWTCVSQAVHRYASSAAQCQSAFLVAQTSHARAVRTVTTALLLLLLIATVVAILANKPRIPVTSIQSPPRHLCT